MPFWRIALLSILGFSLPIALALLIAPLLLNDVAPGVQPYVRARLEQNQDSRSIVEPPPDLNSASYQEIDDAKLIDPRDGYAFVVSTNVRFAKLPEVGKRKRLFFKYAINQQPYSGWALALHKWPGSLRPEVYWRDAKGEGGWYTFGDVSLSQDQWYRFTFIVENGAALSMYVTPIDEQGASQPDSSTFLGGFSVKEVLLPESLDSLYVSPLISAQNIRSHPVESSQFFIAEVSQKRLAELESGLLARSSKLLEVFEDSEVRLLLEPSNNKSTVQS